MLDVGENGRSREDKAGTRICRVARSIRMLNSESFVIALEVAADTFPVRSIQRTVTYDALRVDAEIAPANIVAPDHQDVWLSTQSSE